MTILKCLFNNSTLRVADEFNDIVNLGTLFKFIFDFLQCFSRVQSTLVDDTDMHCEYSQSLRWRNRDGASR